MTLSEMLFWMLLLVYVVWEVGKLWVDIGAPITLAEWRGRSTSTWGKAND